MNQKASAVKAGTKAAEKAAAEKGAAETTADASPNPGVTSEAQTTATSPPAMGAAPETQPQTSDAAADDNAPVVATQAEKRISPKIVLEGNITDMVMSGQLTLPSNLYVLIGQAYDIREGETEYGPWTSAVGSFEAERISDGKVFMGGEAHVPGAAGDLLCAELRRFIIAEEPQTEEQKKKRGKRYQMTGEKVDVAVMVGIRKSSRTGGAPYEFTVTALTPVRRSDALAGLRQQAMRTLMSLPVEKRPALPSMIRANNPALPAPDKTE